MTVGSRVKVNVGLYAGIPAKVVEMHGTLIIVEFITSYRVRYQANEVTPIKEY